MHSLFLFNSHCSFLFNALWLCLPLFNAHYPLEDMHYIAKYKRGENLARSLYLCIRKGKFLAN